MTNMAITNTTDLQFTVRVKVLVSISTESMIVFVALQA